jgi:putative transposase
MVPFLVNITLKPQQIHTRYRHRFGIESSYRSTRQLRIRTNSRNPAMRFLFMALGLILVNVWLCLRFRFTQLPQRGRGGRPLEETSFRLKRFASFLRHAIERRYPICSSITAPDLPLWS